MLRVPHNSRFSNTSILFLFNFPMGPITKEQIIESHETFCLFDRDGDGWFLILDSYPLTKPCLVSILVNYVNHVWSLSLGCITLGELSMMIKSLGLRATENELHEMISEVDANGSGAIEFEEFLSLMAKKMNVSSATILFSCSLLS